MTIGKRLQKKHDDVQKKWLDVRYAIEKLQTVKPYNLVSDVPAFISSLKKDENILSKELDGINSEIKELQKTCTHEKESYTGHCHKWDHYKCDECGRKREE